MKSIMCLPVAGVENPYQRLMMAGLKDAGNTVIHGKKVRVLSVFRSLLFNKVDYVHFDWIHQYYLTNYRRVLWLRGLLFFCDIQMSKVFFPQVRWVWTIHNIYPHIRGKTKYDQFIRRLFARKCITLRVFSDELVNVVVKEFGVRSSKVKVIPEGSYVEYYQNVESSPIHFEKRTFTCLFLGQIKEYKGVDDLLSIAREMLDYDVHFLIVGKIMEPKLEWLQVEAQTLTNVTFINEFIDESQISTYYKVSDIVVLPFKNITNSGSAILAMGFSKPVIAPSQGVLQERLSHQKELLYQKGNLKQVVELALSLPVSTLAEYGSENLESLKKNTWKDFSRVFL